MEAKLVVVSGAARPSEFKLKLPTIIGRSRSVDLPVGHPLVSRQHCELFVEGEVLKIRDLGSLNGTYVNDERIAEDTVLAPGATFTVGPLTFQAVYSSPAAAVAEQEEPAGEEAGELTFPDDDAGPLPTEEAPAAAGAEPQAAPGRATVHDATVGGGTVNDHAPVSGEDDGDWLNSGGAAESPAAEGATGPIAEDDFLLAETPGDAFDTTFDSAIDIPQPAASPKAPAEKGGKKAADKALPAKALPAKAKKAEKAKPAASAEPKPAKAAEAPAEAAGGAEEEMDFAPPPRAHGEAHSDDLDNLLDFLQ